MSDFFRTIARSRTLNLIRGTVRRLPGGGWAFRTLARAMNRDYEERFHHALLGAVRPGDTVWDVGANVGFYTEKFLNLVGDAGHVVAIEPAPASADRCRALDDGKGRLTVMQVALGRSTGTVRFSVAGDDQTSVTNKVSDDGGVEVEMLTGDALLGRLENRQPDILKLDVEGFETDALEGMTPRLLGSQKLRSVFVEVHSTLLAQRGIHNGGEQIEKLLQRHGYDVDWVDFSHIVASRRSGG